MKIGFVIPTGDKPYPITLDSLEASVQLLEADGHACALKVEVGPYISHNRSRGLKECMTWGADAIIFLDHDLSWDAEDLRTLISTDGEVIAGTYRYKKEEEEYMGTLKERMDAIPFVRDDGAIRGFRVPAGFLKITRDAVRRMMREYPELCYGDPESPNIDLFCHGAYKGIWYGEDMAFSRRWIDMGGAIWIVPDLNINHHTRDEVFPGNYHQFLMRQPGGKLDPARKAA